MFFYDLCKKVSFLRKSHAVIWLVQKKAVPLHPLLRKNVSLAQLVEQLTLNQWVEGSSPSGDTKDDPINREVCRVVIYMISNIQVLQEQDA